MTSSMFLLSVRLFLAFVFIFLGVAALTESYKPQGWSLPHLGASLILLSSAGLQMYLVLEDLLK